MITIENEYLSCSFEEKGAEWKSLKEKVFGQDLLWNSDPAYWSKSAPILFPIVGTLKNGSYEYQGKTYSLPRHGFARERVFQVAVQEPERVVFRLESDDQTRAVYPFEWTLEVEYRLNKRILQTIYRVTNRGNGPQYFSIGAHPAFKTPLMDGEEFENYFIDFEFNEQAHRWLLNGDGLLSGVTEPLPSVGKSLILTRPLFERDALVFKKLKSARMWLRNTRNLYSLTMEFPGFPYFGIWTAKNAPFVCLEPWCGVADSVNASGKLEEKEGIETLAPGQTFTRSFAVTVEGI